MTRANRASERMDDVARQLGISSETGREVTLPGVEGRRVDIVGDRGPDGTRPVIEHKSSDKTYLTEEIQGQIAIDASLDDALYSPEWIFDGEISAPLAQALDEAGIPYTTNFASAPAGHRG